MFPSALSISSPLPVLLTKLSMPLPSVPKLVKSCPSKMLKKRSKPPSAVGVDGAERQSLVITKLKPSYLLTTTKLENGFLAKKASNSLISIHAISIMQCAPPKLLKLAKRKALTQKKWSASMC